MRARAVIFDIGGVVVGSPLHAIAAYERDLDIPEGTINRVVVGNAPAGAWSRLERGELPLEGFFSAFDAECREAGAAISARTLMARIAQVAQPRPLVLSAIRRLREAGLRVAALTNNWEGDGGAGDGSRALRAHFDVFVESSAEGLRKPDPRIYQLACRRLEVEADETVFLDDIGRNLKAARALGMTTIKVDAPDRALAELGELLGLPGLDGRISDA